MRWGRRNPVTLHIVHICSVLYVHYSVLYVRWGRRRRVRVGRWGPQAPPSRALAGKGCCCGWQGLLLMSRPRPCKGRQATLALELSGAMGRSTHPLLYLHLHLGQYLLRTWQSESEPPILGPGAHMMWAFAVGLMNFQPEMCADRLAPEDVLA